jgi:ABC-2 type transport system permease protein
MLWYKAWLETRVRFLICFFTILAFCIYTVHSDYRISDAPPLFYRSVVHNAYSLIAALWLVAVVFLAMGGLLREQTVGAAPFTLALPFTRARLMGTRIGLALAQAVVLIVVPSITVLIEGRMYGEIYPVSQAWFHFVPMVSGGLVFFAIALLSASLVRGEYTAPLVAFFPVAAAAVLLQDSPLSPLRFMGGDDYFEGSIELFTGQIPWLRAIAWVLVAAVLLAASVKAIQVREF